jgi:hypothetical protein
LPTLAGQAACQSTTEVSKIGKTMSVQYGGQLPLKRKRIGGFHPCESCGYKTAKVKVTLALGNRPSERVTHRLCERCDPKQ